ncbi:DUF1552 domain-containing protein [Nannocystis bainbridge]|uniref:DUF1552 domain-containing protein n=1 Tax=Nannocystis bainbridge TaxID=2995303 RepID=A0ABT5DZ08_9BACT|nr:DUF1552 domain-containing protein [Nannocystis bainbridge]MDC0718859.1 DUF1552 domain-containing protein [Nannocystis bainbridge]
MKRHQLSRRTMLRGVAGGTSVALALPLLEVMLNSNGTAHADGTALPRRMITWHFGNGVALVDPADVGKGNRWAPAETGPGYPLTPQLAALEGVREYCNLLTGFDIKAASKHRRGHHDGCAGFFSGYPFIELPHAENSYSSKFGGPSIDQVAAAAVGAQTFMPSLQLAISKRVIGGEGPTLQYLSHKGPDQPLPPFFNPQLAFAALFESFVPPDDPTKGPRVDILDAVREDVKALKLRVGSADKLRLDAHLASVEQIKKQIETLPPACILPGMPIETNSDMDGAEPIELVNAAMVDIIIEAFRCDLTRIVSIQFSGSVGYHVFKSLGHSKGHHDMTHDTADNEAVDQSTIKTVECFAVLLNRLKETPEGDGNLLDNSCVILGSDAASGYTHSVFDQPCIVAGRGGGALRYPAEHYHSPSSENTSDILLACLQSVVPEATEVGATNGDGDGYSNTPCAALLA